MIQHIFKLINKQWKKNIWIILELFIVISLMWYIVDSFSVMLINSRTPVGYDIKDTYLAKIVNYQTDNPKYIDYPENSEEPGQNYLRIIDRIRNHPDVVGISVGTWHYPYCASNTFGVYRHDSIVSNVQMLAVTPEYFDVFNVRTAGGEALSGLRNIPEDGVIISKSMEETLFPGERATGQTITFSDTTETFKVVGVTTPIKDYIYRRPQQYIYVPFKETSLIGKDERYINFGTCLCFKTRSGFNEKDFAVAFKEEMQTQLNIGNFYLAGIVPLSELRDARFRSYGVYETIQNRTGFALFFLFNVFLGVVGTFWLRIEKRKEEIGLRIAVGSSRKEVTKQLMTESLVLMLIALIPSIIIWINIVILEMLPVRDADITWQRILCNTLFTIIPLVIIILLATWYPARRSAKIQPAEALHYE